MAKGGNNMAQNMVENHEDPGLHLPIWAAVSLPILALVATLVLFLVTNPMAVFQEDLPPVEDLSIQRVEVVRGGFKVTVFNDSPNPVTVSQVLVDEAYWKFRAQPSATLPRLGKATLHIPYPWVEYEAHVITLITPAGMTFEAEVPLATPLPGVGWRQFTAYGLIGVFVGIVPVVLGMLWFPALQQLNQEWLDAVLALTVGLLVFLLLDTFLEALELARELPQFIQGIPMAIFSGLLTWLLLLAVGSRSGSGRSSADNSGLYLAGMIALGIGLHNMGEGLAIGAAFATGEAALGSFLVIGFMLHNITEGIGISAPLLSARGDKGRKSPRLLTFLWLALLAGAPASLGAWVGGFAFSPMLATVFFGVGMGAIWQVIVEVVQLMKSRAERREVPLFTWANLAGFSLGILVMYLTAFLT